MNQPVEARDDCYRKIGGGVAGEFDDRLIVRQLAQVAVQQQGLLVGIAKQGELPARHAQEVAEGLQTAVVANRRLVAGGIGRASLAGWIDQLAAIGIVEILLCAPLDLLSSACGPSLTATSGSFPNGHQFMRQPSEPAISKFGVCC